MSSKKKYKKNNYLIFLLIGIIILLGVLLIYILINYNDLKEKNNTISKEKEEYYNKYSKKKEDLNNLDSKFQNLKEDLESKEKDYNQLVKDYNSLIDIKDQTISKYTNLIGDYNSLVQDLNNFREDIQQSMEWFKENSTLQDIDSKTLRKIDISLKDCIVCNSNTCKIKLACINLKNTKVLDLEYSQDKKITNKEDKLQSLNSFLENKKGDCEDYTLLFSSEFRYIVDNLIDKDKKIIVEPIIYTNTSRRYYIDEDEEWYYDEGIEGIEFEEYNKICLACGQYYDLQENKKTNHCFNIISKNVIKDHKDLNNIDGIVIDPQGGNFIGKVNKIINIEDQNYSIFLIDQENSENTNNIYLIITKNDLIYNKKYLKQKQNKWLSYTLFLEKINNLK